jgi:outer membrane receptor protein involved in Fe transport
VKRFTHSVLSASLCLAALDALASDFTGRSLEDAIEELEIQGLAILYSSDLVKPHMVVTATPSQVSPRGVLEEIVAPHGIRVTDGPGGMLLLTRAPSRKPAWPRTASALAAEEVIVAASRYEWVRIPQPSLTRLSDAELRLAPNVGDDPLRTIARLPGAAGPELTAKLNVRGGASNELLVRFDGLRLTNPFHLKDFQSIFSAIDPALIGAVDVYTGGFPLEFGDRMSGVLDIHPRRAEGDARREIAVSLFNASLFGAGRFDRGRGDWAASARRGNLDNVLDWSGMRLGEPGYTDVYGRVGRRIGDSFAASLNLLQFDDDIDLADTDLEEQARARYRDRYLWLRLDAHPHESLTGSTIVSRTEISSSRNGAADQPGISRGTLSDRRELEIVGVQTDWRWDVVDTVSIQLGAEWRGNEGRYSYRDEAEFDLIFDAPGAQSEYERAHAIDRRVKGDQYGAYAGVRVQAGAPLTLEGGVRWDRASWSGERGRFSPRASLLYRWGDATAFRAGAGRFTQSQSVDELEVSDGVTEFAGAQRADHWLIGVEQRLSTALDARLELYEKRYSNLRPRFENLLNSVVILPELKPDRIRLAPSSARATGVEVSLRSMRTRPLFWWASYTWSHVEDVIEGRDTRRSWDQQHIFNAGLGWESERWELSFAGVWRSGWPTTPLSLVVEDEEAIVIASDINSRRLRSYVDIDLRIGRKFSLSGGDSLTAFFELSNALDRRNECCMEYEIDDEIEEPTLTIEPIRGLPLLPSVGIIWRF